MHIRYTDEHVQVCIYVNTLSTQFRRSRNDVDADCNNTCALGMNIHFVFAFISLLRFTIYTNADIYIYIYIYMPIYYTSWVYTEKQVR